MAQQGDSFKKTKEEIAEAYRSPAWWYDCRGFVILTFAYNSTLWRQVRFFGNNMGAKHIEIACGTATLTWICLLWRRWKKMSEVALLGIDYAPSMLAGAKSRFKNWKNVTIDFGDATDLKEYPHNHFDTANIANSVHCFPGPIVGAALREALRIVKPGGYFCCNALLHPRGVWPLKAIAEAVNKWGIKKQILVQAFDRDQFRGLMLAAGWEIVSEEVSGNCYEVKARKPGVAP